MSLHFQAHVILCVEGLVTFFRTPTDERSCAICSSERYSIPIKRGNNTCLILQSNLTTFFFFQASNNLDTRVVPSPPPHTHKHTHRQMKYNSTHFAPLITNNTHIFLLNRPSGYQKEGKNKADQTERVQLSDLPWRRRE